MNKNKRNLAVIATIIVVIVMLAIFGLVYQNNLNRNKKTETTNSQSQKQETKPQEKSTEVNNPDNSKNTDQVVNGSFTNEEFTVNGAGQEFRLQRISDSKYYWLSSTLPNIPEVFKNANISGTKVTLTGKYELRKDTNEDFKNDYIIIELAPIQVTVPTNTTTTDIAPTTNATTTPTDDGDWERVMPMPTDENGSVG